MADLNYNVPEKIAAAFREFCEHEGLIQLKAVQWACFKLINMELEERQELIGKYKAWAEASAATLDGRNRGKLLARETERPGESEEERSSGA